MFRWEHFGCGDVIGKVVFEIVKRYIIGKHIPKVIR